MRDVNDRETIFERFLKEAMLVKTERYGKHFWITFSKDSRSHHFLFHLCMTAYLQEKGGESMVYETAKNSKEDRTEWPSKYAKAIFGFSDTLVAFCDPRRFGRIRFLSDTEDPRSVPPLCELGFDPVLNMPTEEGN